MQICELGEPFTVFANFRAAGPGYLADCAIELDPIVIHGHCPSITTHR
jgi:hypothetical protein